jgi:aconitate hydratase
MGAELGATTSVFPSDDVTKAFLRAQGREGDWTALEADGDAVYEEELTVDLSALTPLAAKPHMPDHVDTVENIGAIQVDQVFIGSCTNSSYQDMMTVAAILKGKTVHPDVSLVIGPGSKQVLNMIAQNGALADMIDAGARILESACGPCIGMGQSPRTNAVSLRTNNRNFEGRSGTVSAHIYIVSPETAAASAIAGVLTDPRTLGAAAEITLPEAFPVNDNMIVPPAPEGSGAEVTRGPNIKPFPVNVPLPESLAGEALIKVGDNITTDHIMPSNAKLLPYRSNIPYLSDFCMTPCDPAFPSRAKEKGGGFIIGGANYGQGSSREHAALVPLYLGVKAVIAKSFARIHMANLINSGILPLTFRDADAYDGIDAGDALALADIRERIADGGEIILRNKTKGAELPLEITLSPRQRELLLAGGLLNYTKKQSEGK